MDCPKCKSASTRVLHTYRNWRVNCTRRTHRCKACEARWPSYQLLGPKLREILRSQPKNALRVARSFTRGVKAG